MNSTACRGKNHYAHVSDAMRAARRYELRDGYKLEWYLCDECDQYHLRTRRHGGVKVLSLDALQQNRDRGT